LTVVTTYLTAIWKNKTNNFDFKHDYEFILTK